MEDTKARERLAADLRHLVAGAGPTLSGIEARAEARQQVVRLGKATLGGRLSGDYVRETDEPFRYLDRLLEPRALDRSDLRPRAVARGVEPPSRSSRKRGRPDAPAPRGGRSTGIG
ncbi:hypothetical protein [Streptomyces erythrochromogenes]|uniref:hypothetical protein n=1 Tax=Streptomyces erythrochromogenes TaxID=285574 RepID=UPI0036AC02AA